MTDKQIIIDGVDVSGCKRYEHEIVRCNATLKNMCFCGGRCTDKKNADCYFKQLKRKEQECNKFYIQLKADEEYHEEEKNTLRKIIKNKEERNIELYKENNKLKQTLTEIKEIAKRMNNECFYNDFSCDGCDMINGCTYFNKSKILQIIKEMK